MDKRTGAFGGGPELLSTGEYRPACGGLFARLTPRRQDTLRAAVEVGYYEEPREVTYRDVANEPGIAAGTMGGYLRKVGSTLLTVASRAGRRRRRYSDPEWTTTVAAGVLIYPRGP